MAPIAVMLTRAHAFSGRNKKVLALLASCYLCLFLVDIWAFCRKVIMPPQILYTILGGTGCFPNYGEESMALRIGVCIPSQLVYLRAWRSCWNSTQWCPWSFSMCRMTLTISALVGCYFNGLGFPCGGGCGSWYFLLLNLRFISSSSVLHQVALESGRVPRALFC